MSDTSLYYVHFLHGIRKSRLNCVCTTCGPSILYSTVILYYFGFINQTGNILTGVFVYKGFGIINQVAKEAADFVRSHSALVNHFTVSVYTKCHFLYEISFFPSICFFCVFYFILTVRISYLLN